MEKIYFYSRCNLTDDGECIRKGQQMTFPGKCAPDGDCQLLEDSRDQMASKDISKLKVHMDMVDKDGDTIKFEADMQYPLKP